LFTVIAILVVAGIAVAIYHCSCRAAKAPLAGTPAAAAATKPTIHYAWAQLVPQDADCTGTDCAAVILFRAIVPRGASCEGLATSVKTNQPMRLSRRDNQKPDRFPIDVCESRFAADQNGANLADGSAVTWGGLAAGPQSIAIIGDTGCDDGSAQNCNAVRKWPLARVAADAAWLASDLVIHVGDYRYRDRDDWQNWKTDFFEPARALLLAAPWIMVRGNHENCFGESGFGWAFLLSPAAGKVTGCEASLKNDDALIEPTTAIDFKGLRIVTIDAADAKYRCQKWHDLYQGRDLKKLQSLIASAPAGSEPRTTWVLSHYPLFDLYQSEPCPNGKGRFISTRSLHALLGPELLRSAADAVISGDLHTSQLIDVRTSGAAGKRIVQFVAGNGGTYLDGEDDVLALLKTQGMACDPVGADRYVRCHDVALGPGQGFSGGDTQVTVTAYLRHEFGFMSARRDGATWRFRTRTFGTDEAASGAAEISCIIPRGADDVCKPMTIGAPPQ
jgi:hypothetical protein